MDVALFVQVLGNLLPSEDLTKKNGFSEMPDSIKRNFILPKRKSISDTNGQSGLIFELFKDFEVKYLSFGEFSFNDELCKKRGFFVFAESSYSELTFANAQSEIIEFDNEENSLLNYCASNSSNFFICTINNYRVVFFKISRYSGNP